MAKPAEKCEYCGAAKLEEWEGWTVYACHTMVDEDGKEQKVGSKCRVLVPRTRKEAKK